MRVTATFSQGMQLAESQERVTIPADKIEESEIVVRIADDLPGIGLAGDLLIVEPRNHAATGELVIATLEGRTYIGRWWAKHGTRKLLDVEFNTIIEESGIVVLGAVNLVVRVETG